MATTQKRAAIGGEVSKANGEFYEGGKFIATRDNPKSRKLALQATKKQEIGHCKWEVPPVAGARGIFKQLAGIFKLDHAVDKFIADSLSPQTIAYYGDHLTGMLALVERYNVGERWILLA